MFVPWPSQSQLHTWTLVSPLLFYLKDINHYVDVKQENKWRHTCGHVRHWDSAVACTQKIHFLLTSPNKNDIRGKERGEKLTGIATNRYCRCLKSIYIYVYVQRRKETKPRRNNDRPILTFSRFMCVTIVELEETTSVKHRSNAFQLFDESGERRWSLKKRFATVFSRRTIESTVLTCVFQKLPLYRFINSFY